MAQVSEKIAIADSEFSLQYTRSAGPGGQNVNKVNSKAILTWNVLQTSGLSAAVLQRFLKAYSGRISVDGDIVISSDRYRDQKRNVQDCIDKLSEMIRKIEHPPKPRKPTKPSKGSVQRRLTEKKQKSERKENRRRVDYR